MSTPFNIGISFHTFTEEYCSGKWSFDDMMELATYLGGGVEIVGPAHQRGFPHLTYEFERQFKSAVQRFGLTPTSYGSYADPFMLPDRNLNDDELVAYTVPQMTAAATLGFSVVRLQFFVHPVVERLLPLAEKLNIKIGYELHAPLIFEADATKRLIDQILRIDSPHLGIIPDCGIFCRSVPKFRLDQIRADGIGEPLLQKALTLWADRTELYEAKEQLDAQGMTEAQFLVLEPIWGSHGASDPQQMLTYMPHIIHMHGKYFSLADGDEPDVRYGDVVAALIDGGYKGWISTEYEGPGTVSSFEVARGHQDMLRHYIEKHSK